MNKQLIIVFVKNLEAGKVKTRLAKSIGHQAALEVYKELVKLTEGALGSLEVDRRIYFSEHIDTTLFNGYNKDVQQGSDLGLRMKNAFEDGFNDGYEQIVLIGSDLPDISSDLLIRGLSALGEKDTVFGQAKDGGYYLIGLSKMVEPIFEDKPWSQDNLLQCTLNELDQNDISYALLETLNDIDTVEDLEASDLFSKNSSLRQRIK